VFVNISAILVVVKPEEIESMRTRLGRMNGIQVHHIDAPTGRLVVTQEAPTVDDEVEALRRLQRVPGVLLAEMVVHHFEQESEPTGPLSDAVPERLKS
jgi:nitrate reductase NapD